MATLPVSIDPEEIEVFCRQNHVVSLSLFGSILTERFSDQSDIDILVEFDPAHVPGYFDLARMERELSERLGRKVDLRTPGELSRYFRDAVVANARLQYERR